jgi:transcriptional regulator with XRE-family HTH domain
MGLCRTACAAPASRELLTDSEAPRARLSAGMELLYPPVGHLETSSIRVGVTAAQKGIRTLNENLRRALLRARLTDADVAARLEVDPKTVRRWLEGRLPYLRHRWALATMLNVDEIDLWPLLRPASSRPAEVLATYPHLDDMPLDVWLKYFGSANQEISILANSGHLLAATPEILTALRDRANANVQQRICLRDPRWPTAHGTTETAHNIQTLCSGLRGTHNTQIRLHQVCLSNNVYCADDQLLVSQQAFGIPAGRAPVMHIQRTHDGSMATTYIDSFNLIWSKARQLNESGGCAGPRNR